MECFQPLFFQLKHILLKASQVSNIILISLSHGPFLLGQLAYGHGRCSCTEKGSDSVQRKALGKIEVFPKSSSCDHVEIM